jgi:hypothetical protein
MLEARHHFDTPGELAAATWVAQGRPNMNRRRGREGDRLVLMRSSMPDLSWPLRGGRLEPVAVDGILEALFGGADQPPGETVELVRAPSRPLEPARPLIDEETSGCLGFIALNLLIASAWAAALSFVLPVTLPIAALAAVSAPFVGWLLGIWLDWRLPARAQGGRWATALVALSMGLWVAIVFAVARTLGAA